MLTNIMCVTLYVTDQDRALRFYTEQLGLEVRVDQAGPDVRFLTVGVPGSPVEIILWSHPASAGQPVDGVPGATPGPVFIESDDLMADFKTLSDRGVTFDQPEPVKYPYGLRIEVVDPDGNRIALRERGGAASS